MFVVYFGWYVCCPRIRARNKSCLQLPFRMRHNCQMQHHVTYRVVNNDRDA
jgi:hypothetical protein